MSLSRAILVSLFALSVLTLSAEVQTGQPAPDFTLSDARGNEHSLSAFKGKYVVLEWLNPQCPFVQKHYQSGNMQALQEKYTAKDVVWLAVNSSAEGKQGHLPPSAAQGWKDTVSAHVTAVLLDHDGKVGRLYGAKTTPHMFIINPEGELIYQGAIDSIRSADPDDIPEATNYVSQALDAAMGGEEVAEPSTRAYGCSVKY